ncbi:uncharacterized protein LOC117648253 [Thrips palmi]|uniref:Uncharacterized protein LOC117648253 n=1 Tax=Thrips palmi TaxID=161013 RepID=A0A6P8Z8E6_THRPL|nr:uncharacterized protein LOC117648253 [Thrips palmi]XP_034246550.1 uncharacterized protein LOC117648253 [Thrips palmi]XP_034246551.1 uncharacterized protein LOC117648253 [Thrips palmi]XP_034246552.1 uncharacterized protein LOC117648253 [Thrips palmi]
MPPKKGAQRSPASDASKRSRQESSPSQRREGSPTDGLSMEWEVLTVKEELSGPETANMSGSTSSPKLWCRDCGEDAAEDCEDSGHSVCSLRQLRLEEVAPKLQRLDKVAKSAREVVKALLDAKGVLEAQLEQWRGRLRHVEEAKIELWAAADEGRDLEEPTLEEGLEQLLQDATTLLQAKCQLQVDSTCSTWNAGLVVAAPGSRRSLLGPLVLQLHQDRTLTKVFRPEECMDVGELSKQKKHSKELDETLEKPGLDKVRKLDGVWCQQRPNWCKVLLQRVAPHVEWLWVDSAVREHLEVIRDMPALRYLYVHVSESIKNAPGLPLQLEELQVVNAEAEHLQSVQRMPSLRKFVVKWYPHGALDVAFPPLPAGHCGLQWLGVSLRPASTALSLAKAHAATLQELRILCASEGDGLLHFKDLAEGLRQCGLVALRRVVLMRSPAPGYPDENLPHAAESCQRQKQAVWDKLLARDAMKPVRIVEVLCKDCDKCPQFPPMGDFTWRDE